MMCAEKQDDNNNQGDYSQAMNININNNNSNFNNNIIHNQNIQSFQDHHFLLHQHHNNNINNNQFMQNQNLIFQSDPQILNHHQQWPNNNFIPNDPYSGIFSNRSRSSPSSNNNSLQFAYETDHHHHMRILSDAIVGGSSGAFGLQAELGKMTAQEIMDAKALAASKSHSEAERRRRERINNHLAKLRSLLPSTTKTDKASLLAEVIQHVKELKRQTSVIAETSPVPTETDELIVDHDALDEEGRFVIKASLCCEDRSDLIPDLIKTLKGLRLRTLKAEITTLGGRVKNVLFVTGDEDHHNSAEILDCSDQEQPQYCITSIQEALKAVIEKKIGDQDSSSGSVKRQRTANNNNNNINIYP